MISNLLADAIYALRPRREPDFLIGPSEDDPYMRRWWIIPRNRWFNIYMHHMLHDDDDRAPHDHPWWSLSLCLRGVIKEHQMFYREVPIPESELDVRVFQHFTVNWIKKGQWKFRDKNYVHRLELPFGDAWTLFITGPNVRTWGFHCPKGFVPWRKFVAADNPGQPGRGCGELS